MRRKAAGHQRHVQRNVGKNSHISIGEAQRQVNTDPHRRDQRDPFRPARLKLA